MPHGQVNENSHQVYFIQGADTHRIKIGVSKSPVKRLYALQVSSGERLDLLFYVPGSRVMEHEIHERFKHLRHTGEWFEAADDLFDFMRELWQHRQAHRASFMGYDKDKFYEILKAAGYGWTHRYYVNGALYWYGHHFTDNWGTGHVIYNTQAIEEFRPARLPQTPPTNTDLFTPKELSAWTNVVSTT